MVISIGCDHAGFELKIRVREWLEASGHEVADLGVFGCDSADYPDYAIQVAEKVVSGQASFGILICGTGIGMAMAANKVPGIRAAACSTVETARMSRLHNDANVLSLGARLLDGDTALAIVRAWLETTFDGGERHLRRLQKMAELENRRRI